MLAVVLVVIALSSIGPMIGLAVSVAVLYFSFKQYHKSPSSWGKVFWGVIGIIAIFTSLGNLPAIIGVVALYVLFVVYKKWKQQKVENIVVENDPFTNFEKQWNELNKY